MLVSLRRYPVKSMCGEELAQAILSARGIERDREWALVDRDTGRVVSAKYPRKWGRMLTLAARADGAGVSITFPDDKEVRCGDEAADEALAAFFGRSVYLSCEAPDEVIVERVDPVVNGELVVDVPDRPVTTGRLAEGSPQGTFFDYAPLHLVTTATLNQLHDFAPGSRFDAARFRPNLVLDLPGSEPFAENGWSGAILRIGDDVVLRLGLPAPRCAIPTLAQLGLPQDNDVIRTIACHNRITIPGLNPSACVGCYADVIQGGMVRVGDPALIRSVEPADASGLTLITPRLALRPLTDQDTSAIYQLYSHWDVAKSLVRTPFPFTWDAAYRFVADAQALFATGGGYVLAMVERRTGDFIGVVSLTFPADTDPQPGHPPAQGSLGYAIRHDRWGQRFASEAVAAIVEFARESVGLTSIRATVMQGNVASQRVLERLGFTLREAGVEEQPLYGGSVRLMDRYMLDVRTVTHPERLHAALPNRRATISGPR